MNLRKEEIYEGRRGRPKKGVNIDTFKGKTRDIIAKQSKVATGTVHKVKFIRDKALAYKTPYTQNDILDWLNSLVL